MRKAERTEVGLRTGQGGHVVQTHFLSVNPLFRGKAAHGDRGWPAIPAVCPEGSAGPPLCGFLLEPCACQSSNLPTGRPARAQPALWGGHLGSAGGALARCRLGCGDSWRRRRAQCEARQPTREGAAPLQIATPPWRTASCGAPTTAGGSPPTRHVRGADPFVEAQTGVAANLEGHTTQRGGKGGGSSRHRCTLLKRRPRNR